MATATDAAIARRFPLGSTVTYKSASGRTQRGAVERILGTTLHLVKLDKHGCLTTTRTYQRAYGCTPEASRD